MKRNKEFYDGIDLQGYFVSIKYRFLRYKNYTGYSKNMYSQINFVNELRIYEIKLFGKWFIYYIKKIKNIYDNQQQINDVNEHTKRLHYINTHIKSKHYDSVGIPPNRLTLKQVHEIREQNNLYR